MNINRIRDKSPNIILIILDCVRAQNLPFYGYSLNTMPNLSRLMNDFVVYPEAISSNNWTLPSVASTLTGTYLSTHGLVFDGDVLQTEFITLPEFLNNNGYETLLFSSHPYLSEFSGLDRGFSRTFNKSSINGLKVYESLYKIMRHIGTQFKNNKSPDNSGKNHSIKISPRERKLSKFNRLLRWYITYFSDRDAKYKINKFIKWHTRHVNAERSYFALFHFFEAHTPYIIPHKYRRRFVHKELKKEKLWKVKQGVAYPRYYGLRDKDFRINECIYNGAIFYLDRLISKLIYFLKKRNDWSDTFFVITSDHGENLGEHGLMYHKFVLFDTLIKIPMIIKFPREYEILSEQHTVQNVDIFPTVVDMAGKYEPRLMSQFMGNSLLSNKIKNREYYFAISELLKPWQNPPPSPDNLPEDLRKYWDRFIVSYRTKDFKYIHSSTGDHEFYDLLEDKNEKNNIINKIDEKHLNNIRKRLKPYSDSLKQKAHVFRDRLIGQRKVDLSNKDITEKLKSLGYF